MRRLVAGTLVTAALFVGLVGWALARASDAIEAVGELFEE